MTDLGDSGAPEREVCAHCAKPIEPGCEYTNSAVRPFKLYHKACSIASLGRQSPPAAPPRRREYENHNRQSQRPADMDVRRCRCRRAGDWNTRFVGKSMIQCQWCSESRVHRHVSDDDGAMSGPIYDKNGSGDRGAAPPTYSLEQIGRIHREADLRERVAIAIHASMAGCPEFWLGMPDDGREGWRENADAALAAVAAYAADLPGPTPLPPTPEDITEGGTRHV